MERAPTASPTTAPRGTASGEAAGRIFISHSSRDRDLAFEIVRALEQAGILCWIAPRNIPLGADYSAAIMEGITSSRALLLVYTRNSNESDPVHSEVERARSRKVPLILVRLEEETPSAGLELLISRFQWIDAFPPPLGDHLDGLVRAVKEGLEPGGPAQAQPAKSRAPVAKRPLTPRRSSFRTFALGVFCGVVSAAAIGVAIVRRYSDVGAGRQSPGEQAAVLADDPEFYEAAVVHAQVERVDRDGKEMRVVTYRNFYTVKGLSEKPDARTLRREEWSTTWGNGVNALPGTEQETPEDSGSPNHIAYYVKGAIPTRSSYAYVTGGREEFPLEKTERTFFGGHLKTGAAEGNFGFDAAGRHFGTVLLCVESETLELSPGGDQGGRIRADNTSFVRVTAEMRTDEAMPGTQRRSLVFARWNDVQPDETVTLIYAWKKRADVAAPSP